ncbi:hypothetical protein [Barnesiella intestinihominis]|uniref:hypothetical protein n=1 Tax=Barnesiella intestinihominis TaxID=487174 RepID=UPI003AAE1595
MREYVIENVDFIQLTVNPGENRVYFPVSTHLQGKKILWLESYYVASGVTYDLAGRYPLLMSTGIYVTLYDMDGNLIVDSLTIDYFNSFSGNNLPRIDAVIDWERSFLSIQTEVPTESVVFFSVYIGSENLPIPSQRNIYNLTVPVTSQMEDITLYRKVQALEGKRITGIYVSSDDTSDIFNYPNFIESGYLYFVPKDKSRFLNCVPITFFSGLEGVLEAGTLSLRRKFIAPVEIDFNRSKIYIRSTDSRVRNLNLAFCYE